MDNRELDKWLALNIMGWRRATNHWVRDNKLQYAFDSWQPTESDSHARQVVDKMMERFPDWFFTLDVFGQNYQGDRFVATFQQSAIAYIVYSCVSGKTGPLAICLAVKEAIEEVE